MLSPAEHTRANHYLAFAWLPNSCRDGGRQHRFSRVPGPMTLDEARVLPSVQADNILCVLPRADLSQHVGEPRSRFGKVLDQLRITVVEVQRRRMARIAFRQQTREHDQFVLWPRLRGGNLEPARRRDTIARAKVGEVCPAAQCAERVVCGRGDPTTLRRAQLEDRLAAVGHDVCYGPRPQLAIIGQRVDREGTRIRVQRSNCRSLARYRVQQ